MKDIHFPIFVLFRDCSEVRRYISIAAMQSYFEPIDVENDEYQAWDATATPLRLLVSRKPDWLRVESSGSPEPEGLAEAIREFARRSKVEIDPAHFSLLEFAAALEQVRLAIQQKRK